jgi:hypothetical protein
MLTRLSYAIGYLARVWSCGCTTESPKEYVIECVREDWTSLQLFVDWQDDEDVMIEALKQDLFSMYFMDQTKLLSREFAIRLAKEGDLVALAHALGWGWDRGVVVESVSREGAMILMGSDAFLDDEEIVLMALGQSWCVFPSITKRLRNDTSIFFRALETWERAVQYFDEIMIYLWQDHTRYPDVAMTIWLNTLDRSCGSRFTRGDHMEETLEDWMRKNPLRTWECADLVHEPIRLIIRDSCPLRHASREIRDSEYIVWRVMKTNRFAYRYASRRIKRMEKFRVMLSGFFPCIEHIVPDVFTDIFIQCSDSAI